MIVFRQSGVKETAASHLPASTDVHSLFFASWTFTLHATPAPTRIKPSSNMSILSSLVPQTRLAHSQSASVKRFSHTVFTCPSCIGSVDSTLQLMNSLNGRINLFR